MKIRLDDFDGLKIELGNGRMVLLTTTRKGPQTDLVINAGFDHAPITFHFLTGRDEPARPYRYVINDGDLLDELAAARMLVELLEKRAKQEASSHV